MNFNTMFKFTPTTKFVSMLKSSIRFMGSNLEVVTNVGIFYKKIIFQT